MNLNTKQLAAGICIAGILALGITFGLYKHNQRAHDANVHNNNSYQYLAASKDVPDGEAIDEQDVMVVNWTSDQPVVGAYSATDKAKVFGRIVAYPVANGMLITDKYLAGPDSSLGLPHKIPPGERAIAIRTDEVNDLGGFLYPGVKVDILAAIKVGGDSKPRSLAVVQDVVILSTGKQIAPDPTGKPLTVSIVNVLVSPEQAQKIALAQQEGTLYFSLRNGRDDQLVADKPALYSDIAGVAPAPEPERRKKPLAEEAPFPAPGTVVQTTIGDKTSTQLFRKNVPANESFTPPPPSPVGQPSPGVQQ